MSFFEILDTIILKPLILLFEVVYKMSQRVTDAPGISIIMLSLFMNFLVLPLYMRADAIQEEENAIEKRLQQGVEHIKKTFRGDERMLLLQTYYRQSHYKPYYVLRSAVSLFLQIPFFIAAYRFLSGLSLLNGVSFGPIADLSKADGMLVIGGAEMNLLPVIMTAVNLISCVIFTKGSSLKTKIQLYAMALFFLVFLYASPSGLVLYWTLNNVFSLGKTAFYKMKDPGKIIGLVCSAAGVMIAVYGMFFYHYMYHSTRRKIFFVCIGMILQVPALYRIMAKKKEKTAYVVGNKKVFFPGVLFLTMLTGALIPSSVIKASPQEFIELTTTAFYHPIWFIVSSFCMALGGFVLWMGVFYYLAKPYLRVYFGGAAWAFSGIAVVDYMFFGRALGLLDPHLKLENGLRYSGKEMLINAAIVLTVLLFLYIFYTKRAKFAAEILMAGTLAVSVMTAVNIAGINDSVSRMEQLGQRAELPELTLSRTGKNVIVLMLDRAIGGYIPYIFHDKPELEKKFSGFTYYANTVSYGGSTNFGVPPLFGGYEYTPIEMNKRNTELLRDKHNEALKVMPILFDQSGYDVTVCDVPYANYEWSTDLSIYDEYSGIKKYITDNYFVDPLVAEQRIKNNKRNFFCYSVFKILPTGLQRFIYDEGCYNQTAESNYTGQYRSDLYTGRGMNGYFLLAYNVLDALPQMTKLTSGEDGSFLMMANNITHAPMLLQEPDCVPEMWVDNTGYAKKYEERYTIEEQTLKMETEMQVMHYQVNVRALLELGEWFDYMREEGVYDNTKIIIVSDHGCSLQQLDNLIREDGFDIEGNYALLMVKDFEKEGFEISDEFMTNADVPAIAVKDVVEDPVNPFTGNRLEHGDKTVLQYIIVTGENDIEKNNGKQFLPATWYSVQDDMRKSENWKLVAEDAILPME